jgi:hypothetical protein
VDCSAIHAIADALDAEARARVRRALALAIGALLSPREDGVPPPHPEPPRAPAPGTLATGRPGSRHPLSEARADRAHAHSVVREENPHGATKLSSAPGLTQEREGETLASGRGSVPSLPSLSSRPSRPIDEARDRRRL